MGRRARRKERNRAAPVISWQVEAAPFPLRDHVNGGWSVCAIVNNYAAMEGDITAAVVEWLLLEVDFRGGRGARGP